MYLFLCSSGSISWGPWRMPWKLKNLLRVWDQDEGVPGTEGISVVPTYRGHWFALMGNQWIFTHPSPPTPKWMMRPPWVHDIELASILGESRDSDRRRDKKSSKPSKEVEQQWMRFQNSYGMNMWTRTGLKFILKEETQSADIIKIHLLTTVTFGCFYSAHFFVQEYCLFLNDGKNKNYNIFQNWKYT